MTGGLKTARFLLVMSSLSPVFLLWAIRGVNGVDDELWIGLCLMLFSVPNLALKTLLYRSKISRNVKTIDYKAFSDHREQLITYLLAMMLPLVEASFAGIRDAIAAGVCTLFTIIIFWLMDLHYMNIFFLVLGYRIYEITVDTAPSLAGLETANLIVITKQRNLTPGSPISGYRLGGNVIMETGDVGGRLSADRCS